MLGRRLRLAVMGGGPGSFIGAIHRQAARLDDRYELEAEALSSDPLRAVTAGLEIGLSRERAYACGLNLITVEAIAARRSGQAPDPRCLHIPNSWDGLIGYRFADSVIQSSQANGQWTDCSLLA